MSRTQRVSSTMKDIDHGWAWVVLAASFAGYFISCGLFYNIGIFFVSFLDAFNESRSYTAWVGALLASMFHIAGPLSSLILPYIGARGIFLLGGCLMGFSYAILFFAQSILYITIFYGLFGGIGCFFVVSGCLKAVTDYFNRRMYLAAGVMSAGGGLGTIAIGILSEIFIDVYGWRGSLLLMSAIALHICVCACLVFRQPEEAEQRDDPSEDVVDRGGRYHFLRDFRFWFLSMAAMAMNFAGFSLYVFLKDVMLSKSLPVTSYWLFVVWLGMGSALGRATSGFLSTLVDPLLFYFGVSLMCAAGIFLFIAANNLWAFYVLGCLFGACHGNFCVLQSIKIAHVYGRKRMPVIWGFGMSLGSLGVLVGPPIGGFIADKTGSYDGTLALYACAMLVSGLCSLMTYFVHRGATSGERRSRIRVPVPDNNSNGEVLREMLPMKALENKLVHC